MNKLSHILDKTNEFGLLPAFSSADGSGQSYGELHHLWSNLKSYLIGIDCSPQKRIGILISSKEKSLICIGGILLSDNIYVPLDFNAPLNRNIFIIQDNFLYGLFIESQSYQKYKDKLPEHTVSDVNGFLFLSFSFVKEVADIPTDLAYILNTSGSTGRPKGVMVRHENALSFINWASSSFKFDSKDKFSSIAPFHFDLSIFDLYVSLKHGASLLLFEPSDIKNPMLLAKRIAEEEVSVLYATPTVLMLLLRYGKLHKYDYSQLRYVFFAGEVFPIEELKNLKVILPHVKFSNWYGPTETNVCTHYTIPDEIDSQLVPFPIGQACLPDTTRIASDGELLVCGDLVTPGYWNSPDNNATSFTTDNAGIRWYKTGDIVSQNSEGSYVYKGRKDRMIKRRGYRIELDELEYLVRHYPGVQDSAIIVAKNIKSVLCIICYFTLKSESTSKPSSSDFREYLIKSLPIYMLPDNYYFIDQLPKTSTQKTDYQTLLNQFQDTL